MKPLGLLLFCSLWFSAFADDSNYTMTDPGLKAIVIDSDPKESFFGLQCDGAGRLFVGAREGLFVYEPDPKGLYQPRKLLYRFPASSWIGDIAIRGNDLYVATHTAIYLIERGVVKRDGLTPKRLLWGLPPLAYFQEHQGFHGLAFGPEGDLYVSFGDNLIGYGDFKRPDHFGHWTFYHGKNTTPFTGCGGVVRISPDGDRFSVIATGLRNPCGLAFDSDWDLFSNDNDHESIPQEYVPGRLLHITPHADFAWPRGWLIEKHPWRADLLDTMNSDLGRYVPAAEGYYNDTFLPETFRNCLYVAEWGKGMLLRYPIHDHGATFKADERQFLAAKNNARPVGVTVGRGGRMFMTALYMAGNDASPVVKSDLVMITRADDTAGAPFDAYDEAAASDPKLAAESGNASWSRRYRARIELSRRGKIALPKALDDATLVQNLTGKDPRLAHAALIGILDHGGEFPFDAVLALARGGDSYLRQTAVQILAAEGTVGQLQKLAEAPDPVNRLVGVLALGRRLTVPAITRPLPDYYPSGAPNFAPTVEYADGTVELNKLGRLSNFTLAEVWARKKTKTAEEETIFELLQRRLDDADEQVAKEAAFYLRLLADPLTDAKAAAILNIKNEAVLKPIAGATVAASTELPAEYLGVDWKAEAAAGSVDEGRKLFNTLGCVRCHAIKTTDAGGGGPSLADAGKRFSAQYLAESILVPNKVVAPAFRWTALTFNDGDDASGLVVGESSDKLELIMPNGVRRTYDKSKITSREIQNRSPMPEGLIQNHAQLRSLLAYLLSDKP